jgi:hypothetical protein
VIVAMDAEEQKKFEAAYADLSPESQEKVQAILREYSTTYRDVTEAEANEAGTKISQIITLDRASRISRRRSLTSMLRLLREAGWMVAVHNDYRQDGKFFTFWLFTHSSGRWLNGEAGSDEDAVWNVYSKLYRETPTSEKT